MEQDGIQDVSMTDDQNVTRTTDDLTLSSSLHLAPALSSTGVPVSSSSPALKGKGTRVDHQLVPRKDGPKPAKFDNLPYATSQTGLVYDVRMRFHVEFEPTENDLHPEDPRRIHAIFEAFVNAGLAWREGDSPGPISDYYMGRIDARMVRKDEVLLVHTEKHWNWVQSLSTMDLQQLSVERQHPAIQNDSIYLSNSTPYCAALSAGGAIEACRAIILGKVKNVFAVIRPPGHHAEREDAKGFCFYDNVTIATKVCQREFKSCRKVMVLDWDVHHGNGIQQANYDDPNVLYISLHVHNRGTFYPEGSYRDKRIAYGDHLHCGEGAGLGKNVNIPWSRQGMGDADYIYAFQQVVMPIATEFDPDLVVIAAGFDAAEGDMLGGCKVTPAGYAHMTHMLMSLAKGKLAVCLEGGYNLDSIARSATAVGRTMMGEPPDRLLNTNPTASGVEDVKLVLRQQSKFWSCLYPKDLSARLAGPLQGERMHNVVRGWQAKTLFEEYEMTSLFINRNRLAKEFEDQVLATPNYADERPLLIVLHDPPEVLASPDPTTGKIELHNTWLTDVVKSYVDAAYRLDFGVIDVNLPRHVADGDTQEPQPNDSVEHRIEEAHELLKYLWDNYIELNDNTHVLLMGTNIGHGAILKFLNSHRDRAVPPPNSSNNSTPDRRPTLTHTVSFVEDVSLVAYKSPPEPIPAPIPDHVPSWYYNHSLVFVAHGHNYFNLDLARKPRKRFGRVQQSPVSSITDMLVEHRDAVVRCWGAATQGWREERRLRRGSDGDGMDAATTTISPAVAPMETGAATAAAAAAVGNLPDLQTATAHMGNGGDGLLRADGVSSR